MTLRGRTRLSRDLLGLLGLLALSIFAIRVIATPALIKMDLRIIHIW